MLLSTLVFSQTSQQYPTNFSQLRPAQINLQLPVLLHHHVHPLSHSFDTANILVTMDLDSDDDFEKVDIPSDMSDSESEPSFSSRRKTSTPTASTPATTASTPFCREKRLLCPYEGCDKAFNRPVRLEEHIRSHTNERPFKCHYPFCDKDYLRESHLKHHIKSAHTDIRDYTCTFPGCGKSFATGQRLKVHQATHDGPNKYICREYPPCNQVFRKKETLQRHIQTVHENQEAFQCSEIDSRTGKPCNKSFANASKLAAHERQAHDPSRFSCSECIAFNARLANNSGLNVRERFEYAKQAYFSSFTELQTHNAEEHPPTCNVCSLPFTTQRELTRHNELIHGIVNPNSSTSTRVSCPYPDCDKTFSRKGNLNVHIRTTHENRRDFICGQTEIALPNISEGTTLTGCGRDFAHKNGLVDHVLSVHLGLPTKGEKKRQAEDDHVSKPKKQRKDKGWRKLPAIADSMNIDRYPFADSDINTPPVFDNEDESDIELDGTTTMVGSMLYAPDGAYRYVSDDCEDIFQQSFTDQDPLPIMQNESFAYSPSFFAPKPAFDPDFDKAFALEPEMSNALDPMLFLSTPSQHTRPQSGY